MKTTIKNMIITYLTERNFSGLCNAACECGCEFADFMPCGEVLPDCVAVVKNPENDECFEVIT